MTILCTHVRLQRLEWRPARLSLIMYGVRPYESKAWCSAACCPICAAVCAENHMGNLAALLLARYALKLSFCNPQVGAQNISDAVGRMVQRGVLPSLRRLSLGAASREVCLAGEDVPRPDAAPHVETALLPVGRRPPGQQFWATDDVLPDLHVALGVRADYDWERPVTERAIDNAYGSAEEDDWEQGYNSADQEG